MPGTCRTKTSKDWFVMESCSRHARRRNKSCVICFHLFCSPPRHNLPLTVRVFNHWDTSATMTAKYTRAHTHARGPSRSVPFPFFMASTVDKK